MAESARTASMSARVKHLVAQMLEQRITDPRLGFVTVTDVKMTGDLQHASVFYTVMGDEEAHTASAAALRSATGKIRSEVGRQLGIRLTPTLEFVLDAVPQNVNLIDDLLATAASRDADIAAHAASAQYAGEADPYRVPRDDDDDDEPDDLDDADRSASRTPMV